MINRRLHTIAEFIDSWCETNQVIYSVVCDENDLQGILLFKTKPAIVNRLLADLRPLIATTGVHLETTKIRGGTVIAFSVKAISETTLAAIIAGTGEGKMDFADRIINAFTSITATTPKQVIEDNSPESLLATATKIVDEGQYKSATQGATRANQTSLQRQRVGSDHTLAGPKKKAKPHTSDDPQATTGASQPATGPQTRFENRIANTMTGITTKRPTPAFNRQLAETLQGMATPGGVQPGDLFSKFAQSLNVLGTNLGVGPLQDQLKKQGINWKKSDDGQSIILYVMNAQTNAPQPITRISASTLEKPADFETQLLNIMDFAKGDAPGTFKQRQQEFQNQEKAAREIAKQLGPQDNNIAQQMNAPQAPQAPQAPAPQTPAPQPTSQAPAPKVAAAQAAMPKQPGM